MSEINGISPALAGLSVNDCPLMRVDAILESNGLYH